MVSGRGDWSDASTMTKQMEMWSDSVLHSEVLDAIDAALDALRVPEQPSANSMATSHP
jgi:hypothetical protein